MDMENIQQRHREERKKLQGEIMGLKKAAKDKKAKKEATAKVALLEAEMEARHEAELAQAEAAPAVASGSDATPARKEEEAAEAEKAPAPEKKESKAARRRAVKAAEEAARAERIAAGEVEAASSQRVLESQAMESALEALGLAIVEVPADGDCLFSALAHQLSLRSEDRPVSELREAAATAMEAAEEDFRPFLVDESSGDLLDEAAFKAYTGKVRKTGFWGGEPEMKALAQSLSRPIRVVQAQGQPLLIGDSQTEPLTITYHHHAYRLGRHYNSTKPRSQQET